MLLPTLACPASCSYCFGPHEGGGVMGRETLAAVVEWQRARAAEEAVDGGPSDGREAVGGAGARDGELDITFHGGEPLLAGAAWYRTALPLLREGLAPRRVRFTVQSNLWLLDDGLCELFAESDVALGTSLDGPEPITDAQRGAGYFARNHGRDRARPLARPPGGLHLYVHRAVGSEGRRDLRVLRGRGPRLLRSRRPAVAARPGRRLDPLAPGARGPSRWPARPLTSPPRACASAPSTPWRAASLGRPWRPLHLRRLPGRVPGRRP